MTPAQTSELKSYQTQLATRFAKRRCRCGAAAVVVSVGSEAKREAGILLQRAQPDRNLCMWHAGLLSNEVAA
jgi:hypothetical protein